METKTQKAGIIKSEMESEHGYICQKAENKVGAWRNEDGFFYSLSVVSLNGAKIIDARFYCGKAGSTVRCVIWIKGGKYSLRGVGSAGGYGYHRSSSALGDAIRSAGIKLSKRIDGVGDEAMDEAVLAIAKTVYGKKVLLVKAGA